MKTKIQHVTHSSALFLGAVVATTAAHASTDYGPATYRPPSCTKWYTSGNGHHMCVCHDMEGYYASTISYLNECSVTVSIHYMVNGKSDTSTDYPAGDIDQQTREANYAWHARCWNTWMWGTEHEGFESNPAWFTSAMYNATAGLQKHLITQTGHPIDRNHIIGHNQGQNSAWVNWVHANYSFDPTCNSHTDPGKYWDWTTLMNLINGTGSSVIVDNSSSSFTASSGWATATSSTDKYGSDYRYHSTAPTSDDAVWNGAPSGSHTVYVWYAQGSNRSTTAPYFVEHSGSSTTVNVNQQTGGGAWNSIGTFTLASGDTVKLSFWTGSGFVVIADAVKWQ